MHDRALWRSYYVTPWLAAGTVGPRAGSGVLVDVAKSAVLFFSIEEIWPQEFYLFARHAGDGLAWLFLVTSCRWQGLGAAIPARKNVWTDSVFLLVERFMERGS